MSTPMLPASENLSLTSSARGYSESDYRQEFDETEFEEEGGLFDIGNILAIFHRNRLLIAAAIAVALVAGVVVTLLTTPLFKATATLQIEQRSATIVEDGSVEPVIPTADTARFLQTQASILKSRALADQVRQSLKLDRDDNFLIAMGEKPARSTGKALAASRKARVLALLQRNLEVSIPTSSRIGTVTFTSPSNGWAAKIANSYAENYIQSNLDRRIDSSRYAREFLLRQIGETKGRLEASERALLDYARAQGLIDMGGDGSTLPSSNLRDLNTAYSQARVKRLEGEQRWRQAQTTPLMALPDVIASPVIGALLVQRSQQMIVLDQLRARYHANHPSVEQAESLVASIDSEIADQARNIRDSVRATYLAARSQEESVARDVSQLRSVSLDEQGRRVRYNILKREVDTNRTMYDALLQRYKEIAAGSGVSISNVSVIDAAQTPARPSEPSLITNLLIALFAGAAIAVVAVFLRERFDDVVRVPEEVQRKLGVPLLGSIPLAPKDSDPESQLSVPQSALSEAYHTLRTAIEFSTPKGAPRSLLFTSSRPGEGKSTSAIAIAEAFARLDRRVLLIDGDLRKPSLHNTLRLSSKVGFVNLLTGQLGLAAVVQKSRVEQLDVMACGPLPPNPTELLASNSLAQILAAAARVYDMIIIDGPPGMGLADAQLLAREVEAVAFIVEAGTAHRGQAKVAIRRLLQANNRLIGAVLTKFDANRSGYGYNYSYSYSYGAKTEEAAN